MSIAPTRFTLIYHYIFVKYSGCVVKHQGMLLILIHTYKTIFEILLVHHVFVPQNHPSFENYEK